jgi:hypothetical protein
MSVETSVATQTPTDTEQQMIKRKRRENVLARIRMLGTVDGTMQEIRHKLGLDNMPMKAFRSSCYHLWKGDRDDMKAHITSWRPPIEHIGESAPRPFVLRAI